MQQTFRSDTTASDGVPLVNTQRADPDWTTTCRTTQEFSQVMRGSSLLPVTRTNVWEAGILYRFFTAPAVTTRRKNSQRESGTIAMHMRVGVGLSDANYQALRTVS
jgi:hypothetical protein